MGDVMNMRLTLDQAAYYSIQIQGTLDQDWADQFGELRVYTIQQEDPGGATMTTVVGKVTDQAALAGLLNLLYSLQLSLIHI